MFMYYSFLNACGYINTGQSYDLNNIDSLPTVHLAVFHKAASLIGSNLPMGIIEVSLDGLNMDGAQNDAWYPIQKVGRMKDVAGDVSSSSSSSSTY